MKSTKNNHQKYTKAGRKVLKSAANSPDVTTMYYQICWGVPIFKKQCLLHDAAFLVHGVLKKLKDAATVYVAVPPFTKDIT